MDNRNSRKAPGKLAILAMSFLGSYAALSLFDWKQTWKPEEKPQVTTTNYQGYNVTLIKESNRTLINLRDEFSSVSGEGPEV